MILQLHSSPFAQLFQRFLGIRAPRSGKLVLLSLGAVGAAGEVLDASLVLDMQRTGVWRGAGRRARPCVFVWSLGLVVGGIRDGLGVAIASRSLVPFTAEIAMT
jgi:hypothetical protein